jgi:dipeptidyl aminopeptidase/acylaminoacyl peptidase
MVVGGRTLAEPRLSPDGSCVVVHVRDGAGPRLVRIDLGDGTVAAGPEVVVTVDPPVTSVHPSGGGSWTWWPDGSALVYVASTGLHVVPRSGGAAALLANAPDGAGFVSPTVAPDGRHVAVIVESDEAQAVAIIECATGSLEIVASGDAGVFRMDPTFRPDGALTWHQWEAPSMPWDQSLIVTRFADGAMVIDAADGAPAQPAWSPDGSQLAVVADSIDGWRNVMINGQPVVAAGRGEPFEHGMPSWGAGQRSWCWSPNGAHVAFVRNEAGFARLCVADVATGVVRELGKAWHLGLSWSITSSGGERLAAIRTGGVTPAQLVVYDLTAPSLRSPSRSSVRRTVARGPVGGWEELDLPEPEVVHWSAADGTAIHGRIFTPASAHGGVLVSMHGGPTDQTTVTFSPRFAFWLSEGWTIFTPDHRGSTGWGRDYQQAMNGEWGALDVTDTAEGVRGFVAAGRFDPTRIVVTGGSAGGFCALHLLLRHPELFCCGVALYPVTDLAELDATTHRFERFYNRALVGPVERYAERSPMSLAASLQRPLLLLHGDADLVVSADQSRSFAAAARAEGADVEIAIYEGEGHGWKRPETTVDELDRTVAFLSRHCPEAPSVP